MNLRGLIPTAAGLLGLLAIQPASAAISVIMDTGSAHNCFIAAEFPDRALDGIRICTKALNQQPLTAADRAATYVNRGNLRIHAGDVAGAIADYNKGMRLRPTLAEAHIDRGVALLIQKHDHAALADFNKGLALGPSSLHVAFFDRALAREALGDLRGAYRDYKAAVKLAPKYQPALKQLARFKVVREPADKKPADKNM